MHVAVLFIGTSRYIDFLPRYHETVRTRFLPRTPKQFFVFTDRTEHPAIAAPDISVFPTEHQKWPLVTLLRFKTIMKAATELARFSHVVFIDGDMYVDQGVEEAEFFAHDKPLFGVQHPGFVVRNLRTWVWRHVLRRTGTFERDAHSLACVAPKDDLSTYWQGCFWGGTTGPVLEMVAELERRIDDDLGRGVIARWHDESHLNRYFIQHRSEVHTFDPGYAYPERWTFPFARRIVHIAKDNAALQV